MAANAPYLRDAAGLLAVALTIDVASALGSSTDKHIVLLYLAALVLGTGWGIVAHLTLPSFKTMWLKGARPGLQRNVSSECGASESFTGRGACEVCSGC